ncbi:MAG TPA: molybdopterin-dependent oxidoreductase, partial [Desulfomonilaceae bacterium]|nr:molybdopterin-dependent oxidoreductase [Desulfomonilaceae bacterium]
MKKRGMTRRKFIIGSAAGGASILAASYVGFDSRASTETAGSKEITVTPTLCDGCGNWCAINVYTRGGKIWKAEGNPIAGNNVGRICAKGHALLHETYNKDRIKSPLKRVGPNQFQPISWEQAYREIGEKVRNIVERNGPESLFWLHYPEGNAELAQMFMAAMGSPNVFSHGSTCFLPRNIGWWLTTGSSKPEHDFENTRFVLLIGRNPAAGLQLRQLRDITIARDRGARIVVVDPRFSESASVSHEWLRIRPGTDLALMLAIARVMIEENLYNKDFVERYTEGFEEFAQAVQPYTVEWAEEKTTIPKSTIAALARDL